MGKTKASRAPPLAWLPGRGRGGWCWRAHGLAVWPARLGDQSRSVPPRPHSAPSRAKAEEGHLLGHPLQCRNPRAPPQVSRNTGPQSQWLSHPRPGGCGKRDAPRPTGRESRGSCPVCVSPPSRLCPFPDTHSSPAEGRPLRSPHVISGHSAASEPAPTPPSTFPCTRLRMSQAPVGWGPSNIPS